MIGAEHTLHPLDLELACAGYLRSPDGRHVRYLIGLDLLAGDVRRGGCAVWWSDSLSTPAACCDRAGQRLYLASRLFWSFPWCIRRILSHELGHLMVGPSHDAARAWSVRQYGELVVPLV